MTATLHKALPVGIVALTVGACAAVFWFLYTHDPTASACMQLGIVAAITAALILAWRLAEPGAPRHVIGVLGVVWVLSGAFGTYAAVDSFLHRSHAVGFGNPTEGETGNDLVTWLMIICFAGYGAAAVAIFLSIRAVWRGLSTAWSRRSQPAE